MKVFKNPIFMFILGVFITGGVVFAAGEIDASKIIYKDQNDNEMTVESALNNLYTKASNIISDDNLYLYWLGNEYSETTGGWSSTYSITSWSQQYSHYSVTLKSAIKNIDNYALYTDNEFQYSVMNTNNKIDCTDYNYVNIYYSWTTQYHAVVNFVKSLEGNNYALDSTSINSNIIYTTGLGIDPKGKHILVSYPITCTEAGYIVIHTIRGNSSDPTSDLKVYGVVLSKEPMGIH